MRLVGGEEAWEVVMEGTLYLTRREGPAGESVRSIVSSMAALVGWGVAGQGCHRKISFYPFLPTF